MFEQRQNLVARMNSRSDLASSSVLSQRADESQVHIDRIRAMLKATDISVDAVNGDDPDQS